MAARGLGVVTMASSDSVAAHTLQSVMETIERLGPGLVTHSQVDYLR